MKSIDIAGRKYLVKGELPSGGFRLEDPQTAAPLFAKKSLGAYVFSRIQGGVPLKAAGFVLTATRSDLVA